MSDEFRVGVVYPQTELKGDPAAVRAIARATEELGYDHLLAYDHVVGAQHADREPALWGPYTEDDPFHDPFVLFAYVAAMTERIELVTGVLILPQRQTVIVAKQSADLDLLSGGRFRLGVGTGWNYVEYDALNEDFAVRGPRSEEQISFIRQLWSEPLLDWQGTYDSIDRGNILPRPNRQIPIWLGGFSEPAFRRAGKLADGFIFAGAYDHCTEGWERIKQHLAEAGRSEAEFGRDIITLRDQGAQGAADTINRWRDSGGTHASVCTMRMGLDSAEAHIDFMGAVKDLLG